jgi:hypothetical protein
MLTATVQMGHRFLNPALGDVEDAVPDLGAAPAIVLAFDQREITAHQDSED